MVIPFIIPKLSDWSTEGEVKWLNYQKQSWLGKSSQIISI